MWPKLVAEAKDGGADCIETYVFWNGHETAPGQVRPQPLHQFVVLHLVCSSQTHNGWGFHARLVNVLQYYFEDRFDLVQFARVVKDAGLYLMLRIGPFVAAEWNFGSASASFRLPFAVLRLRLAVVLHLYRDFLSMLYVLICAWELQRLAGVAALHTWNGVPDEQRAVQGEGGF
jgi:hypothetical protein